MGSYTNTEDEVVVFGHWVPQAEKTNQVCTKSLICTHFRNADHAKLLDAFKPILQYAKQNNDTIPCFFLLKEKKDDAAEVITASR